MAFAANPLSLSVPEAAFETWLRDTGYLEILDERTTAPSSSSSSSDLLRSRINAPATATATATAASWTSTFFRTLFSLLTLNPFAKLTPDDFSGGTPSWTVEFIGGAESYSWPAGPSQARMRVQENVRRYARNYAFLSLLFFACSLLFPSSLFLKFRSICCFLYQLLGLCNRFLFDRYRMPISLLGLLASLGLWEMVRFCSDKWELEQRYPGLRHAFVRIAQFATAVVLYLCNLQLAVIWALSVSYAVMIMHASLRKLTPFKQSVGVNRHKRFQQKRHN
ncbi:PRA1 family protein H isoform X1 [Phoenix dactylifera]|uniref:PRA1 family protein H isoform X1 n=1 Tax=Phoenix dactylifera TaxID=42345 RepID=A0A8B9AV89_PHODC|nr:PRA1 family protein H isoform X1 [Phoenix dactylifera]